jgi:hypothetical protein
MTKGGKYTGKNETLQQFDYLREASKKVKFQSYWTPQQRIGEPLDLGRVLSEKRINPRSRKGKPDKQNMLSAKHQALSQICLFKFKISKDEVSVTKASLTIKWKTSNWRLLFYLTQDMKE